MGPCSAWYRLGCAPGTVPGTRSEVIRSPGSDAYVLYPSQGVLQATHGQRCAFDHTELHLVRGDPRDACHETKRTQAVPRGGPPVVRRDGPPGAPAQDRTRQPTRFGYYRSIHQVDEQYLAPDHNHFGRRKRVFGQLGLPIQVIGTINCL